MVMKCFLLVYSFIFSSSFAHDAKISMFKIYEIEDKTQIYMSLDANDVSQVIEVPLTELDVNNVSEYVAQHFSLSVNNNLVNYHMEEMTIKLDHINLLGSLIDVPENVTSLNIVNTCLLNIDGQSNIIQLDINSKSQDFRMHKGRTQITVNY